MNVFYFCSDSFASVMAVSIVSLLENNRQFEEIKIYVADDGILFENKRKLINMVAQFQDDMHKRKIEFILSPDPSKVLHYPFKSRYQMGHSFPRMCIGSILPGSVDRVLCLDSDTLICGSLQYLWNLDLENNIMAGVSDCMNIQKYKKQFWLDDKSVYCNAGMFLVDLKKWRQKEIEKKIIYRINRQNGNVFFFEQTLMNWACKGEIFQLGPEYNCYTLFWAFSYESLMMWRKPVGFFSKEQCDNAKKHPKIIHFTRNFYMLSRPWVVGCDHPMTQEYIKYKKKTPWPELEKESWSKSARRKYKIWHTFPHQFILTGACFLYNYIRPKLWWRNE